MTEPAVAKILLLGDSLTQLAFEGWGAQLANVYQRRADVVNRGCSGYTTAFYSRLPLPNLSNVCLVTIFFGANDASLEAENPHHYVSVQDYSQNLKDLIAKVNEAYNSPRILLITPPPLDHEQRLVFQKQRYGDLATGVLERTTENTKLYAEACAAVAAETKLPCLDLFEAMMAVPDYGRFLCDGLHFSGAGHDFVATCVLQAIHTHFPDLHITPCATTGQWNNSASTCPALDSLGPYHDLIDHNDIDASFPK
jgi:isoamyl acetate esterase